MDGNSLKQKLVNTGMPSKDIAEKLGMTPQALNTIFKVADVKTGFVEKLAKALDLPISYFYGEPAYTIDNTSIHAAGGSVVATDHSQATKGADEELVTRLMAQVDKLTEELSALRQQNERLTDKLLNN